MLPLSTLNTQLSTGFDLAFRLVDTLAMGLAAKRSAVSKNRGRPGAADDPLTTQSATSIGKSANCCLPAVSEMIQFFSAPPFARSFLSNGDRARAGARMAERFTEKRTKDNWRGYYDCAIPLAARHAAGRSLGVRHLGSSQQTADTDCTNIIFRARRRNRLAAWIHQEDKENSTGGQSFGSATKKCLHQKQQEIRTSIAEAVLKASLKSRACTRKCTRPRSSALSR